MDLTAQPKQNRRQANINLARLQLAPNHFVDFAGDAVMCSSEGNNQSETYAAHCYVNHSINTLPTFICPLQSSSATKVSVHSEMKQLHVSQCAYDSIVYNETTFTINITDIANPLTCIVRYSAVWKPLASYAEEEFDVFRAPNKTQATNNEGKYDI